MKCPKCGNEYEGNFCPNCGASPDAQISNYQNMQNQAVNEPAKKKSKKPIYKRWWFWVIIVIVIIIIIVNIGGGSKSPAKETNTDIITTITTVKDKEETFNLNDTAVFNSIKVTATELKESTGTEFFKPESGKKFIGVQFTIENTSDTDQNISSMLLFDAYVDGVKCDYSFNANCAFSDGKLDGTISAGKKMVGYYAVEVPKDWSELELQVKSDWLSDTKAAFVFNK